MKYLVTCLIVGVLIGITTGTNDEFFWKYALVLTFALLGVGTVKKSPHQPIKDREFREAWLDRQYKKDVRRLNKRGG